MAPYFFVKALHLVSVIVWFAGLFYLGRLFVYHRETAKGPAGEAMAQQFGLMERRLYYGITVPGMVLTVVTGILLIVGLPGLYDGLGMKGQGWLHGKLLFVVLLIGYHHGCKAFMKRLAKDAETWTGTGFRLFNEGPSLLLIAIVFIAVMKSSLSWPMLGGALVVLSALIWVTVQRLAAKREAGGDVG